MNSMIIIAIRDSTWPWHWKQEWIKYVDSYGAVTVQNTNEKTIEDGKPFKIATKDRVLQSCPFTACEFSIS